MALFNIELAKDSIAQDFLKKANQKLQGKDLVTNPFNGSITAWKGGDSGTSYYTLLMDPIYPKLYYVGLIMAVVPMLFAGITMLWLSLPGVVLFSFGIFWSGRFYYAILKRNLRKKGYKNKLKYINNSIMIRRIIVEKLIVDNEK